jgi:hypothetical protein
MSYISRGASKQQSKADREDAADDDDHDDASSVESAGSFTESFVDRGSSQVRPSQTI